jgi:hypothetical protein
MGSPAGLLGDARAQGTLLDRAIYAEAARK